jgi:hypothetical protein
MRTFKKQIEMNVKLTSTPDKLGIEKAKKHVSMGEDAVGEDIQISPFIESMRTGISIPSDLDLKKEYADYLFSKYK